MLEILTGGSKPAPKSQMNVVGIEVMTLPEKNVILNLVDIEVLAIAKPFTTLNLLSVEVLTINTGA